MGTNSKTVVVAMSGGVDSSIAAALLKQRGYDVIGITMQIWQESTTETKGAGCCSLGAVEDARRVARKIGIPHYVLNYREYFAEKVIDNFVDEYRKGRTPNPCINCNRYVKFDALLNRAMELGADFLATGHYARVEYNEDNSRWQLRRARASSKDQTYALFHFTQYQLERTLMPLGDLDSKDETRAIAAELGLSVANKPDSQDICFVQGGSYTDFLEQKAPDTVSPGLIVDTSGKVRGRHDGIAFYTIGQRRRINVGSPIPLFVVGLQPDSNTVVVGSESDLQTNSLAAYDCNWVAVRSAEDIGSAEAKIRYNMEPVACDVGLTPDGSGIRVDFIEPVRAVTPGQAIVLYDGDIVLGGGTIETDVLPQHGANKPELALTAGTP
jgi:tRNA-specific 2-thiouridylase